MEKAYKLVAIQEGISNREAKQLIDDGLVFAKGRKVIIARAEMPKDTEYKIKEIEKIEKIFEDNLIVAVNKPAGIVSESLEKKFNAVLLHRLDKGTSGVLILVKNEEFRLKAIEEFRKHKVYKEYIAVVDGLVTEKESIEEPIIVSKGQKAYAKVDPRGVKAKTEIEPISITKKRTKLKVIIETGRTHQIRAHLKHIGYPILGDAQYGGRGFERIMLHSYRIKLFDYELIAKEPKIFIHLFS